MPKSCRLGQLLWNAVLHRNCTRPPSLCFKFLNYFSLVAGLLPFLWRHIRNVFIEDFLFIRNYVATLNYQPIVCELCTLCMMQEVPTPIYDASWRPNNNTGIVGTSHPPRSLRFQFTLGKSQIKQTKVSLLNLYQGSSRFQFTLGMSQIKQLFKTIQQHVAAT